MIEIALRCLYSGDHTPDIEKSTFKFRLKIVLTNVYFKWHNKSYCQVDGPAIGASFAVILANNWMKSINYALNEELCVPGAGPQKFKARNSEVVQENEFEIVK